MGILLPMTGRARPEPLICRCGSAHWRLESPELAARAKDPRLGHGALTLDAKTGRVCSYSGQLICVTCGEKPEE